MSDHTVRRRGTDSSGRGIYASDYMWAWWLEVCDELDYEPTIIQGAWMTLAGGGAGESAGYHDGGGCFDLRTRDINPRYHDELIRTLRRSGAAAWIRDHRHGMDPHIHLCLGSDYDIDDGAFQQWREYLAGGDGLTGSAPDYHWRPDPIVTKPPPPEDPMADYAAQLDRIEKTADQALQEQRAFRKGSAAAAKSARQKLSALLAEVRDDATRAQVAEVIAMLEDADE